MKRRSHTKFVRFSGLFLLPILVSNIACQGGAPHSLPSSVHAETTQSPEPSMVVGVPASTVAPVRYEAFKVQGRKSVAQLESRLGPERFETLLKINRIDKSHIRNGDTLLIPTGDLELMALSPFPPQLEPARLISKLILVSRRSQAFAAYESGNLVRWGPTSTGKKSTPTPAGLYHTNWKARETRSTVNSSWKLPWCFNLDNRVGVSFHQFDLPGYPASHGCVRLLEEDAKWIYGWAEPWMLSKTNGSLVAFGTPVVIFGDYSYGEKAPWKRLEVDPYATAVRTAEIEQVLRQYLPTIQARVRQRDTLIAEMLKPADDLRSTAQAQD